MNRIIIITFLIAFTFYNSGCINNNKREKTEMSSKKHLNNETGITGIGGIFFKCENPEDTRNWYKANLDFVTNEYGSLMEFLSEENETCYLQWSPFHASTEYFKPSDKDFMINYRVSNLDGFKEILESKDVIILDSIARYEYGNFLHILDIEGNKLELWEPVDSEFTKSYSGQTTSKTTIGNIWIRANDPKKILTWYKEILGMEVNHSTGLFTYRNIHSPEEVQILGWNPIDTNSNIFNLNQQLLVEYITPDQEIPLNLKKLPEMKSFDDNSGNEKYLISDNNNQQLVLTIKNK